MSREILFRARRVDNSEWAEGYFVRDLDIPYIVVPVKSGITDYLEADPSTVCQYTGMTDRNGVKIFENDIVTFAGYSKDNRGWIRFGSYSDARGTADTNYGWFIDFIENNGYYRRDFGYWVNKIIVIGNYFDNPELLEGETGKDVS